MTLPMRSARSRVSKTGETLRRHAGARLISISTCIRGENLRACWGLNGSGKTTAINCILALLTFDEGTVRVFGEPISPTSYALKRRIGIVPQNVAVFNEIDR